MKKKPTIASLEALLKDEETTPLHIMSNGEVKAFTKKQLKAMKSKPITLKEDLGGEYAEAA